MNKFIVSWRFIVEKVFKTTAREIGAKQVKGEIMAREIDSMEKLAFEFFKLFSQFEFALKIKNKNLVLNGTTISYIGSETFVGENNRILEENLGSEEIEPSCEYLKNHPPRFEKFINQKLVFVEPSEEIKREWAKKPRFEVLMIHIKRTRNNLFHGGKYLTDEIEAEETLERAKQVVYHSLKILNYITKHTQIFDEVYFNY